MLLYQSYTPIIQSQNCRPPKILNQKWPFLSVECHIWDSMNSWCAIFITKMSMRHFVKDLLIRMPAEHRIYWDQINGFLPLLSRGVAMVQWLLWQYRLSSFQTRDTKLDIFLPKNQHTQRKLLNFEFWINGKLSTFKVNFLCQKSSESIQFFFFFSLKNIKSGAQLLLMTLFGHCHFWSTLFTKIGPKLQTLIPNQALICQRPFLVRKCLFPFN